MTSALINGAASEHADPDDLASLYRHLRVCDVADALDGIGYFNLTLMARDVRPLWAGMKFWGPAATLRAVPSNKPMWILDNTQDIVEAHRIWFERYPAVRLPDRPARRPRDRDGVRRRPRGRLLGLGELDGRRRRRARSGSSPTATAATPAR